RRRPRHCARHREEHQSASDAQAARLSPSAARTLEGTAMITDDDIRSLLTSEEIPASLSPSSVRARAHHLRRSRRLGAAAVAALVVPVLAFVTIGLPGRGPLSIDGAAGYPPAFD